MPERVVGMAVTLYAGETAAHQYLPGRIDPIDHRRGPKFLIIGSTLVVGHRIPMKGRGDQLLIRSSGDEIPGHLFRQEPVIGFVFVETFDQIIAVTPDVPGVVSFISFCICISGQVHPHRSPPFTISGRSKQAVHQLFIGIRPLILNKILHSIEREWETDQVERDPAGKCPFVSLR